MEWTHRFNLGLDILNNYGLIGCYDLGAPIFWFIVVTNILFFLAFYNILNSLDILLDFYGIKKFTSRRRNES